MVDSDPALESFERSLEKEPTQLSFWVRAVFALVFGTLVCSALLIGILFSAAFGVAKIGVVNTIWACGMLGVGAIVLVLTVRMILLRNSMITEQRGSTDDGGAHQLRRRQDRKVALWELFAYLSLWCVVLTGFQFTHAHPLVSWGLMAAIGGLIGLGVCVATGRRDDVSRYVLIGGLGILLLILLVTLVVIL